MARKRNWLFHLLVILFGLVLTGHLLLKYTPIKNQISTVVMAKLRPYLGEYFIWNDFDLGMNYVSVYHVSAADKQPTFVVDLEEVRIGFNALKLPGHGFKPERTIKSVTIRNPRIVLYETFTQNQKKLDISLEKVVEQILTNLQKFPEIDHLEIIGGELYWQPRQGKALPLLTHLDGRISYRSHSKAFTLDLKGRFLSVPNSSVSLLGEINFEENEFQAYLILDECVLTSDIPNWPLSFFELQHSRLRGEVRISNQGFTLDSLYLSGAIEVDDLEGEIFHQRISTPGFRLTFQGKQLIADPFRLTVEDGQAIFGGTIANILKPEADWRLKFRDYSVKYLKRSHDVFEYTYEGFLSGEATFTGPLKALDIRATLFCPELLYAVVPFNTIRGRLQYNTATKLLHFPEFHVNFMKFHTRGEGDIDLNTREITLSLKSDIAVPRGYFSILNRLNGGAVYLNTEFRGDFDPKVFEGTFDLYAVDADSTVLTRQRGTFDLVDQWFDFRLGRNRPGHPYVEGTINNVFSEPDVEILDVRYFPVKALTRIPVVAAAVDGRAVNFYFSGLYNFLRAKMKVTSLDLQREYLIVMSNIRNLFYDDQHFWGRFWGDTAPRKLEGTFDVAFSPEGIHTRVYAPELFRGELSWGFLPDAPLEGKVYIRHFSVADYLANSPMLAAVLQEGALRGEMTIAGTVQDPHIEFDLEAGDFIINQVGYYNARLIGRLQNHRLDLERLIMQLNDETVMQADLHWDMLRDSLEAVIAAQRAESNFLAETLFRRDDLIRGPFGYIIQVSGSSRRPRISGTLQVKNGEFLGKPFTIATLAFQDSLPPDVSPWRISHHIIRIQNFYYDIPQEYHLQAEGIVGVGEAGPLDVRIQAAGNILAELPRLEPYFINPKVDGTLSVWLKGTRSNFVFKDAEVHITRGHLEFDGVIPPVDSLHADIQLDSTTRFVSVNIEGLVDGRRARIFNQPSVTVEGRVLEPWEFEDIGINLGILALETDPRGIPLSIPGLMEPGDIGYFAASGRQPGEHFYLAGPSPRILHPGFEQDGEKLGSQKFPLCRGTITLYNARVTFPFIGLEEDTEEENPVVDFLINMQWDVLAQPGNNVRYFVRIPAYVGEVFMDLNIDNDSPGLEFLGRLADEPWLLEETPEHQRNGFAQFSEEIGNSDSPQWSPASTEPISYLKQPMFRIKGAVESTRGRVEYLDANFRVERFGAEFHELEIYPEVYGRAYTTVRDSTSELPIDIYLVLYVVDPVTKQEVSKGRWEDFRFKLVSSNQVSSNGIIKETQEQVLAYLGYSPANLRQKAGEVGLTVTGNYLIRPLIRPLERQLERRLGLDYVRFRSHFASNLFYLSLQNRIKLFSRPVGANPFLTSNNLDPTLILLQSSEVTLGKYLFRDLYFSYTGQVVSGYEESRLGLNHTFELEYRIVRNFLLEIEYSRFQFNPFYREGVPYDFRIQLRHSFNF